MKSAEDLRAFAERYTAAWCSQDPASVAAFFSPAGSLAINGGAPAAGRAAIIGVAQSFMSSFPDLCVILDDVIQEREHTRYYWTLTGTNAGPGGNGSFVRISGFESWQFGEDGLIAASEGSFDEAEYRRQLAGGV